MSIANHLSLSLCSLHLLLTLKQMLYLSSSSVTDVLVFVVDCDIARLVCAVRVFDVRASSSPPGLPLCQISFLWRPPLLS